MVSPDNLNYEMRFSCFLCHSRESGSPVFYYNNIRKTGLRFVVARRLANKSGIQ